MSRTTDWQPLCDSDPTPGDPDEVNRAGRHYSSMADEIDGQVKRLKDIVSGTLQGGYVEALTKAAEGLGDELSATSGRYREVGGLLQQWGPQLDGFQDEAEVLHSRAATAQGDMATNREIPQFNSPDAPPPSDTEVAAAKAKQGRYDDAQGDLGSAQRDLDNLRDDRDDAAGRIADSIRDKCDDDVKNSRWDDFKDWMDDHADLISGICKVLGVIAMAACVVALFVPGLNVVAAGVLMGIAIGATSASLIGHSMLASTGNGSWWDVGMDVVALATFGAGRFLGPGIKVFGRQFGGTLTRLTAETKAAGAVARGNAARAPTRARINADIAQAERRLFGGVSNRVSRSVRREVSTIRLQGGRESNQVYEATRTAYNAADHHDPHPEGVARRRRPRPGRTPRHSTERCPYLFRDLSGWPRRSEGRSAILEDSRPDGSQQSERSGKHLDGSLPVTSLRRLEGTFRDQGRWGLVSDPTSAPPRTWVLWVVRVVLAPTVVQLGYAKISSIWTGPLTGSFWWLIMALPQVSIALIAILICWAPSTRPQDLELTSGGLAVFGMFGALMLGKWLPLVIGALAILAMFVRPQPGEFMKDGPPPNLGSRRRR